ncbi:p24 [Matsumuraeses phaseoli granulovirus]|uniref:P24 n=1 Tax=Matsumuraeses phaseoli granulovirus TaxID=2760664 RepID=A0AAE7MLE5_9BBAC|nr:p24 [Matsumuraeses phaseoli granulovirus]QOD40025.1 p24 [Matsumuraeses phaseoli granulovirus]
MSFEYNSGPIEVFMVCNEDNKEINGYAEVSAVSNLLSPYTRISTTQLWNTTHASYKIQNGGKNFIHAIAICKYLSSIPENESASYKNLRQLVRDLIVGDQKEMSDDTKLELGKIEAQLQILNTKLTEMNNEKYTLSDYNGLLQILKRELLSELKGDDEIIHEPIVVVTEV